MFRPADGSLPKSARALSAAAAIAVTVACGCGLTLDFAPDDPTADAGTRLDAAVPADGPADGSSRDTPLSDARADAPRVDAGPLVPPPCGGPSALFDDFGDGVRSPYWFPSEPGTTTETDGHLEMDPSVSGGVPQLAAYASSFDYDAREDRVAVRVVAVHPTPGVQTVLGYYHEPSAALIAHDDGILTAWVDGVVDTEPYDPVAHAWWQLRSDGSGMHFEVSPDGVSWGPLGSGATVATPPWLEAVGVAIGTLVGPGAAASGVAVMDDFNLDPRRPAGSPLHAVYCDAHQLMDDFGDFTVDANRWYLGDCPITEGGGTLKIGATTDPMRPCGILTRHAYDLRASQAVFERAAGAAPESWAIYVVDAAAASVSAGCAADSFVVSGSDGARTTRSGCPADPYWRLEVRSGRVVASTSDGSSWSADAPPPPTSIDTTALRIGVASLAGHAAGTEVVAYNPPGL